ncbi:hypothetical protein LTR08_005158 [Meristemomyces frigidus]|nr:hypothetical protein LTR08_005158 [Meristemomyces frigidus]
MPRKARKGRTPAKVADCDTFVSHKAKLKKHHDYDHPIPAHAPPRTHHAINKTPQPILDQLRSLDAMEKHPGTHAMIDLIRRLCRQQWTHLTLRYNEGPARLDMKDPLLHNDTFYDEAVSTRWELVEEMLQFAFFHQELVECYGADYELYWVRSGTTAQLDARMVAFMQDMCKRGSTWAEGKKPQELIVREWQTKGTWETLSASHIVPQEDLAEDRAEAKGYPLRIW